MTLRLDAVTRIVGGETHLADITLDLAPGLTVLLGRTRAGKTSLMRVMAGLDRPTTGRVLADGRDVTGMSVRKRSVAMVYQQFINYPAMTVLQNIASPLRLKGLPREQVREKAVAVAKLLRIDRLLDRYPGQLSGGQQQRTAIARALAGEAELLLLDEPLVNLDYKLREELRAELQDIFARGSAVVVYATTEPQEALLLGGTVAVLDEGRLLQAGPMLSVYRRPASATVGAVFSDPPMNMADARVADGRLHLFDGLSVPLEGHLADLPAGPCRIGLRPAHLALSPAAGDLAASAEIELAEISGSETFVHVGLPGAVWVAQVTGVRDAPLGSRIAVGVPPGKLFVFGTDGRLVAAPGPG
jgi:glycerol transport system ATP-binding protein